MVAQRLEILEAKKTPEKEAKRLKENNDWEENNMGRKIHVEERRRRNREMDRNRDKEDGYDRRDGDRDGKRSGDKYKGTNSGYWMKGFDDRAQLMGRMLKKTKKRRNREKR